MKDMDNIPALMADIGRRAKAAATQLATASAERKHAALIGAAENVWAARADIIAANTLDLEFGRDKGLSPAMMDRLMLDETRIQGIVDGLRAVAEQKDPVGAVSYTHLRAHETVLDLVCRLLLEKKKQVNYSNHCLLIVAQCKTIPGETTMS